MLFTNVALLAAAAMAAPTANANEPATVGAAISSSSEFRHFLLTVEDKSSPLYGQGVTASRERFVIGGDQSDAQCQSVTEKWATFTITSQTYVQLASDSPPYQPVYVDNSGMGQGIFGYTTGAQPQPRHAVQNGFSFTNEGYILQDGVGVRACPTGLASGAWSIWFTTAEKPGFNEGCIDVNLTTSFTTDPSSCHYSTRT